MKIKVPAGAGFLVICALIAFVIGMVALYFAVFSIAIWFAWNQGAAPVFGWDTITLRNSAALSVGVSVAISLVRALFGRKG